VTADPDSGRARRRNAESVEKEVAMKPILLATDGSPSAAEATREAIELARTLGAPLLAASVEHVTTVAYGYYGYADVYSELRKTAAEHAATVLEDVAARAGEVGVDCETVQLDGPIVEQICELARKRHAGMIVLGAHGWGAIRRVVFGSVSLGVLHEAPCPVLVARSVVPGETSWVDERVAVA
jgi:nucleotide-binding universal stress UspA family protein